MNNLSKFRPAGELETTMVGKLVYLVLKDIVDEENTTTIPQKRISEALGISRSTVSQALRKLYRRGYISVIPQFNDLGGQMPNKYIVL